MLQYHCVLLCAMYSTDSMLHVGYDESVSGQDNRREASVQRSVLQGRLYSEIQIVTACQKSLMQALCLFIFGRLTQHSPCIDTLNGKL